MTAAFSILAGPEVFWIAICLASAWLARSNTAPAYPLNGTLSGLYWVAPSLAVVTSFVLFLGLGTPTPSWWLLVRLVLAAGIGACVSTSTLAERIHAGSGRPGLAMGVMTAIGLHFLTVLFATVGGIVLLLRGGGARTLWTFLPKAAVAAAAIAGVGLLISCVDERRILQASGEDKARRLSSAHGEKIGAKFPDEWRDGRKNWTNFEISFVAPNTVRLTVTVKYSEHRMPGDVQRHLEKWNGDVGSAVLGFLRAKRRWRADWDHATGNLIWSVDIGMSGLSKSQFLRDTEEAARLYIGPMSTGGSDSWWLLGDAIDAAVIAETSTGSHRKFALAWLETALGQAAMYCERAGFQDRQTSLSEMMAEAHLLVVTPEEPDAAATRRLLDRVRAAEKWKQVTHSESDFAFLLNGSLGYLALARQYVEGSK